MGIAIESKVKVIVATPTVDTAIYAANDRLGSIVELTNAMDNSSGTGTIMSIAVVDKASQSAAFDVMFFDDLPTVASADNAALSITDAEMAAKFVGAVRVAAADYIILAANHAATVKNVGLVVSAMKSETNSTGKSLFMLLRSAGTPTYTSTTDLVVTIGIKQD